MFEEIGERFGEVISVAGETSDKGALEFGRVCIQLDRHLFINQQVGMAVCDRSFMVSVRKELESYRVVVRKSHEPGGPLFRRNLPSLIRSPRRERVEEIFPALKKMKLFVQGRSK